MAADKADYDLAHPIPSPPPARLEIVARVNYGGEDPSSYVAIICDHQTGIIVYANGRGGVTQYSGSQYACPIILESK